MPALLSVFFNFLFSAILQGIAWLLTDPPAPPPGGSLEEVGFPETAEGTSAPIITGFVWVDTSQMFHHWNGHYRERPIQTSQSKK